MMSGDLSGLSGAWIDTSPHPWRRLIARVFDSVVFGSVAFLGLGILFPELAATVANFDAQSGIDYAAALVSLILVMPVQALLIGQTGTTPGKWLCGVRILDLESRPIGFSWALVRELKVFVFGLGFGLPLVSLMTAWNAKHRLETARATLWDEQGACRVLHRPSSGRQTTLIYGAVIVIVGAQLSSFIR